MKAWWASLTWSKALAVYFLAFAGLVTLCGWLERFIWYRYYDACPRCHGTGRRRP